jgi:hypothetical protein
MSSNRSSFCHRQVTTKEKEADSIPTSKIDSIFIGTSHQVANEKSLLSFNIYCENRFARQKIWLRKNHIE